LAARLSPKACEADPEQALTAAWRFYQVAILFIEEQRQWTNADNIDAWEGTPAAEVVMRYFGKQQVAEMELEKLRLRPDGSGEVCERMGVKTVRAAQAKIRRWLEHGNQSCEDFMTRAWRADAAGGYWAIPERVLAGIKSLEDEVRRTAARKRAQKKGAS
jgi:hypothetical protein